MAEPLDIASLDAAALKHRRDILRKLWHADGRVSAALRALNIAASPRFGLHVSMNDAGAWFVSTPDNGVTRGGGFVSLTAFLADVPDSTAAAFLQRLLPAEAAA